MARYKLVEEEDGTVTGVMVNDATHPELEQGTFIPGTPGNRHWDEYLDWASTNVVDAANSVDWMGRMRSERDQRLAACDWTQIPDVLISTSGGTLVQAAVDAYAIYRQELRDMPQNNPNINTQAAYDALVWPTEPII